MKYESVQDLNVSDPVGLAAFVQKYYIDPIIYDTSYNPVDTITWAIILGLAIIGLIKLLGRLNILMDERLLLSTLPYILAGSSLRVIEDANLVARPLEISFDHAAYILPGLSHHGCLFDHHPKDLGREVSCKICSHRLSLDRSQFGRSIHYRI